MSISGLSKLKLISSIQRATTFYVYDGDQTVGIYNGSGVLGGTNTWITDELILRRYQSALAAGETAPKPDYEHDKGTAV